MTFTRENARKFNIISVSISFFHSFSLPAARQQPQTMDDTDEIPQEIRDQIARMEAEAAVARGGEAGEAGGEAAIKICPHCTFENVNPGNDCEVCGLPLG